METIANLWKIQAVRQAVISILVIVITLVVWIIIRKISKSYQKKRVVDEKNRAASSLKSVIYDAVKISVFVLLVLTILQINGVNVTSLIAGVGVASAVVGLALQDFFKDIIMGIHILMDDFYQIGDVVQYLDDEGVIEGFNLRTTKIRSIYDADLITICNRNIDHISKTGDQIYIHQPLPYELASDKADEVMTQIAESIAQCDGIVSCDSLGINEFRGSNVDYLLKIIIDDPMKKLSLKREALRVIRVTLENERIHIPYDQLDVHVDSRK